MALATARTSQVLTETPRRRGGVVDAGLQLLGQPQRDAERAALVDVDGGAAALGCGRVGGRARRAARRADA